MDAFVTIKTFTYPHEAYLTQGRLETEGINTFLQDELTVQVAPFYSNALGGVKLQVKQEDYDKAMKILGQEDKMPPEDNKIIIIEENAISKKNKCPFCGSENVGKMMSGNWLTFIPFIFLGFIFPIYRRSYKCFDCERKWAVRKHPIINWIKKNRPHKI